MVPTALLLARGAIAPEAQMKVAGGKLRAAQRTHRIGAASDRAPEGAHEVCSPVHAPRRARGICAG